MLNSKITNLAEVLWNFSKLHHQLSKSDALIVLGCSDTTVPIHAVHLYHQGLASLIIFTGGFGKITKDIFFKPEADIFATEAIKLGVPQKHILIENQSRNTHENVVLTKKLTENNNLKIRQAIIVTKPYYERRAWAHFNYLWPKVNFLASSKDTPFTLYDPPNLSPEQLVNLLVGDIQRLIISDDVTPQPIPPHVLDAYHSLIKLGFTQQLLDSNIVKSNK